MEVLRVDGLSVSRSLADETAHTPLQDISFKACKAEIVGIYGLLGVWQNRIA